MSTLAHRSLNVNCDEGTGQVRGEAGCILLDGLSDFQEIEGLHTVGSNILPLHIYSCLLGLFAKEFSPVMESLARASSCLVETSLESARKHLLKYTNNIK